MVDGKLGYSLSDLGRSKDANLSKIKLPDGFFFFNKKAIIF